MANLIHLDDRSGTFSRLLGALKTLEDPAGPRLVLIGGLAVVCHLLGSHRATEDVDFVSLETTPSAHDVLLLREGAIDHSSQRIEIGGVQIDIIDVKDPGDVTDYSPSEQLFLLSHAWALQSAASTELHLATGSPTISVELARPAALVAMKASAIEHSQRSATKRGSDLYDMIRLAESFTDEVVNELAASPQSLGQLVIDAVTRHMVDEVARTLRLLGAGSDDMRAITGRELQETGERLRYLWSSKLT